MSDSHRWLTLAESVHHRLAHHRRGVALLVYASLILAATALASAFSVGLDLRAVGWTDTVLMGCLLVLVRLPLYWRVRLSIGRWRFVGVGGGDSARRSDRSGIDHGGRPGPRGPGVRGDGVGHASRDDPLSDAHSRVWISYRALFEYARRLSGVNGNGSGLGDTRRRRILVAGAGEAGQMIVHQMLRSGQKVAIVGFVDDDPLKWERPSTEKKL